MFNAENYLDTIQSTIDDFCIDLEREGYLTDSHFAYTRTINEHKTLFIALFGTANPDEAAETESNNFCATITPS